MSEAERPRAGQAPAGVPPAAEPLPFVDEHSVAGTVVVETLLFAAGVAAYATITRARDRIGSIALWLLVGFLFAISLANLASPPPPSTSAVAWTAQAMWLLVLWGYWVDRHRETVAPARRA